MSRIQSHNLNLDVRFHSDLLFTCSFIITNIKMVEDIDSKKKKKPFGKKFYSQIDK